MSAVFEKPSLWSRMRPVFFGFDGPLTLAILLLAGAGMMTMYSAGYDHGTRFVDHGRNMLVAGALLFIVAQISPQRLMSLAVPLYTIGIAFLIATALFGISFVTRSVETNTSMIPEMIEPRSKKGMPSKRMLSSA